MVTFLSLYIGSIWDRKAEQARYLHSTYYETKISPPIFISVERDFTESLEPYN